MESKRKKQKVLKFDRLEYNRDKATKNYDESDQSSHSGEKFSSSQSGEEAESYIATSAERERKDGCPGWGFNLCPT